MNSFHFRVLRVHLTYMQHIASKTSLARIFSEICSNEPQIVMAEETFWQKTIYSAFPSIIPKTARAIWLYMANCAVRDKEKATNIQFIGIIGGDIGAERRQEMRSVITRRMIWYVVKFIATIKQTSGTIQSSEEDTITICLFWTVLVQSASKIFCLNFHTLFAPLFLWIMNNTNIVLPEHLSTSETVNDVRRPEKRNPIDAAHIGVRNGWLTVHITWTGGATVLLSTVSSVQGSLRLGPLSISDHNI